MYAVIQTGGKQYRVQSGDRIRVDEPRWSGRLAPGKCRPATGSGP